MCVTLKYFRYVIKNKRSHNEKSVSYPCAHIPLVSSSYSQIIQTGITFRKFLMYPFWVFSWIFNIHVYVYMCMYANMHTYIYIHKRFLTLCIQFDALLFFTYISPYIREWHHSFLSNIPLCGYLLICWTSLF